MNIPSLEATPKFCFVIFCNFGSEVERESGRNKRGKKKERMKEIFIKAFNREKTAFKYMNSYIYIYNY